MSILINRIAKVLKYFFAETQELVNGFIPLSQINITTNPMHVRRGVPVAFISGYWINMLYAGVLA